MQIRLYMMLINSFFLILFVLVKMLIYYPHTSCTITLYVPIDFCLHVRIEFKIPSN